MAFQIFSAMQSIASPQMDTIMLVITQSYPLVILALIAYFAYYNNVNLYPLALALFLSFALVTAMKPFFNETRPCAELSGIHAIGCEASKSFPSGHAAIVFSALPFYSRAPMYAYAILVGFSRIYLGQHYLLDVAGGAMLGLGIGYYCLKNKAQLVGIIAKTKSKAMALIKG